MYDEGGLLVLTVPWGIGGRLRQKLGNPVVRGPEAGVNLAATARVAKARVRLRPGCGRERRWGRSGRLASRRRRPRDQPRRSRDRDPTQGSKRTAEP